MLDDFHCPAFDQKRRGWNRFLSPKIYYHFFCFVYIELHIVFAAPTDKVTFAEFHVDVCLQRYDDDDNKATPVGKYNYSFLRQFIVI